MAVIHKPRSGSLAYTPIKRSKNNFISSLKNKTGSIVCIKAGNTSLKVKENWENVTVLELVPFKAVEFYGYTSTEKRITNPSLEDNCKRYSMLLNLRLKEIKSLSINNEKKHCELRIPFNDYEKAREYYDSNNKDQQSIIESLKNNFLKVGDKYDLFGITKGKGFEGVIRRKNLKLQKRKNIRAGCARHPGATGSRIPARKSWKSPSAGQLGYARRSVSNTLMKIDFNNPIFLESYGQAGSNSLLLYFKGAVPGSRKRIITVRAKYKNKS